MRFGIALLLIASACPARAEYDGPPAEKKKWIAFCVDALKPEGKAAPSSRVYCTCMSEFVDPADFRRLYEWERMFPPAHVLCHNKAGW